MSSVTVAEPDPRERTRRLPRDGAPGVCVPVGGVVPVGVVPVAIGVLVGVGLVVVVVVVPFDPDPAPGPEPDAALLALLVVSVKS
jgi:hypothetical protein